MIQTYFGDGKGKTTAAIGAAIRYTGCNQKVLFVEFLKNNDSAEFKAMDALENIDVLFSNEHYELYDNQKPELTSKFADAYTKLLFEETAKISKAYRMIVLDEVLDAVDFGYIDEDKLLKMLAEMKNDFEIILTGHKLTESIANVSDYISETKEIKHPYNLGISPRKGIEY